jgi:hypothetical protein
MADAVTREQLLEELVRLHETLARWIGGEAQGQTHCLACVCAFLARTLNFDRRELIGALEAEATRAAQARAARRNSEADIEPAAADFGVGPLRALAASLRAFAGPASGP